MSLNEQLVIVALICAFIGASLAFARFVCIIFSEKLYGTSIAQEIGYTLDWWRRMLIAFRAMRQWLPGRGRAIGIDLRFLTVTKHGGIWFWRLGRVGGSFYVARN